MLRISTALFAGFIATSVSAQEVNITYDEWTRMSPVARAAYVAGVIDPIYEIGDEQTYRYARCIGGKLTLEQFSDAIRSYAEAHKTYRYRTVREAMVDYLSASCPGF